MKAAQINNYGDPSVVQIAEVDQPQLTEAQVLVEVHASSLNPFDTTVREGHMKDAIPLQLPATLGGDIAGVVVKAGTGVERLKPGDKVYGQANVVAGNSGAFAELAATKASQLAKMPSNLSFEQAAAMPLVGVSALQALSEHINLKAGQNIFIHGGAGGIGTIAIQIAKHIDAYVATTATGDGIDYVKKLGADQVIDFKSEDFTKKLQDFDAVFDTTPGDDFTKSLDILKPGGVAVSMLVAADEAKAKAKNLKTITQSTTVTTAKLDKLRELIEDGVITPHIDKIFPLDDIRAAFEARESGLAKGKVVIKIR